MITDPHPLAFSVTAHSKGLSIKGKSLRMSRSKQRSELRILKGLRDNIMDTELRSGENAGSELPNRISKHFSKGGVIFCQGEREAEK